MMADLHRSALVLLILAFPGDLSAKPEQAPAPEEAAPANKRAKPGTRLTYVRGRALYVAPAASPAAAAKEAVKVTEFAGSLGVASAIEVSRSGDAVLVRFEKQAMWLDLGTENPSPVPVDCDGRARLDASGACVLCDRGNGEVSVMRLRGKTARREAPAVGADVDFYVGADELVFRTDRAIWAASIADTSRRRKLADEAPARAMLVSPDGQRAVGQYADGDNRYLYSLALDGRGVRRRLGEGGVPVRWSLDSKWLALQQGQRACVARAVGGEYKCWRGFRALGVDADVHALLMLGVDGEAGKRDLYRVPVAGARAANPTRILRGVAAAAWL